MKWEKIDKTTGIHACPQMDMHLTSLGYTQESVKYLTNPCPMHDKELLQNFEETVEYIKKAIQNNQHIVIIGDYDAGATRS